VPETLVGTRVLLRRYSDQDADALYRALIEAQEHLQPWLPGFERPRTHAEVLESVRRAQAQWALRESFSLGLWLRQPETLLGEVRLQPTAWEIPAFNLSYWAHPAAQGHGYVSEALRLVLALAFDSLGAQRVAIACEPRNVRSRRIAERLGFMHEGCVRNAARGPDGVPCDLFLFALLPGDYAHACASWRSSE
jgi:RimJ/RimL family protein N-acetyltransferase